MGFLSTLQWHLNQLYYSDFMLHFDFLILNHVLFFRYTPRFQSRFCQTSSSCTTLIDSPSVVASYEILIPAETGAEQTRICKF